MCQPPPPQNTNLSTTAPPIPPVIISTATPAVVPQPSFHGDYEKCEESTNWIRKYLLSFPPSYSDVDKITWFELQCAAASSVEAWFTALPAADTALLTAFITAFKRCWPLPAHVVLTVGQKKD
ncbi:hypothetical protein DEU56DRAFT_758556 [Suillus clintonianus]|uniref:uncharacterized protein n=1 Tax=Suillus clintonianus TaxID=1904413 RepID=UPI001B886482|nr:uncharacterized protein DEU56DRAFT_758556 [Suillus clintonianus]KAG2127669.1 hypothetical protein DEU56DRAFT_758556 [Suillus clintonianus]